MTDPIQIKFSDIEQTIFSGSFFQWNASDILSLSRKLMKQETQLQKNHPELHPLKIAISGTCNTQYLTRILRPYLYAFGIQPLFYESVYGGLMNDLMNLESDLYRFQPDVFIVLRQYRDLEAYPELLSPMDAVDDLAEREVQSQLALWQFFHKHSSAQVFLTNIAVPNRHVLGNLEANLVSSRNTYLRMVNDRFLREKPSFIHLIDQEAMSADFGKDRWFDDSAWFISKQPFCMDALPVMALSLSRLTAALTGKMKKCLVLDLDNTLWGGVIGDDGLEGINLDPNHAIGEAYLDFQHTLKRYQERGVLLAVCSKNDQTSAEQVFLSHPYCYLKLQDFAAFIANWNNKADNLRHIAQQLNIGLDSLVFFDDNPAEREIVRSMLPEVAVLDVPADPAQFSVALDKAGYFDWLQLSKEDLSRAQSYAADQERIRLSENSVDYDAYLAALEMDARIGRVSRSETERFTQLINKTNQFNLRTVRYSEAEMDRLLNDEAVYPLRAILADKFSNYGLISACILRKQEGKRLWIESWVMSCRVFKRDLEKAMLNHIVAAAKNFGCAEILGEYIPTAKNGYVANLLDDLGFDLIAEENGTRRYSLSVSSYVPCETKIHVTEETM